MKGGGSALVGWQRQLWGIAVYQVIVSVGFSFAMPFLPLYLHDLGVADDDAVKLWAGAIYAGSSVTMAVMGPVWGAVADRFGARMMVLRATLSAVVIVGLMGFVTGPEQILLLRIIQGAFTGVNAAAMTLLAKTTPRDRLGFALGVTQTAGFAGVSLGPLLGGALADQFGYRAAFFGSAALMFASAVIFMATVRREPTVETPASAPPPVGLRAGMGEVLGVPLLLALIGVSFSVQFGQQVISPILPLYVRSLAGPGEPIASTAGLIVGVTALVSSVAAAVLGRLGDRLGHGRILVVCCFGAAAAYLPQAFVTSNTQLLLLRALGGLFWGGLLPSVATLMGTGTRPERRGTAYGLLASANSLGNGVGPVTGATVAVWLGMPSVFGLTSVVLLAVGVWVAQILRRTPLSPADEPRASTSTRSP